MGVVYKAEDIRLKRPVAIKLLSPELTRDDDARGRFEQEAQAASILDHPNICTIHEIDNAPDGRLFIVMAYCDGETLKTRLQRGPLPIPEAVDLMIQILRALEKAHEAHIVHRDVKPANVIITSDGLVKIVDFGIAKLQDGGGLTRTGTTIGTMLYMSPEQVAGNATDMRVDLWAAGVVLYEMLTGRTPFAGDSDGAIVNNILNRDPAPVRTLRPDVPEPIVHIVQRALAKQPEQRYSSAGEFMGELTDWQRESTSPMGIRPQPRFGRKTVTAVILTLVAAIAASVGWNIKRSADARRVDVAFSEASALVNNDQYAPALARAEEIERVAPRDPRLADLMARVSLRRPIATEPAGADVYYKPFDDVDGPWRHAGRTPIAEARLPIGALRWRVEKDGYDRREFIGPSGGGEPIVLEVAGSVPPGMVRIPRSSLSLTLNGYDYSRRVPGADFFIDRYELTNKQFKDFVDAGGYSKREFWKEPFIEDGRTLTWDEAIGRFRDRTGRPGPSNWEVGTFPAGRDNHPVGGVSWYEAAAYAEFAGKSLPTIYHWLRVASIGQASFITPLSNFESQAPTPVGQRLGVTPSGAFDMAGNVREWCANQMTAGSTRYILGGAWNDPRYAFYYADARSPFDRDETNGFRLVKYTEPLRADLTGAVPSPVRDVTKEVPVSDAIFAVYRDMYAYDRVPLDARLESKEDAEHWTLQKVSFSAAYGNDRVLAYLFLPKKGRPPYQTVIYGPGSGAVEVADARLQLGNIDFLISSGRAVLYPVYEGTYDRRTDRRSVWHELTRSFRDWMIHVVNDARRSIDYLEQRDDLRKDAVAYVGFSWGAQFGTIVAALEPRVKTMVLTSGGIASAKKLPEIDLFNFAPRVTAPVLMLNGDSDFIYSVENGQKPLFKLFATRAEHKRHVIYPGGHALGQVRHQMIREILDWLDRYLGPVPQ